MTYFDQKDTTLNPRVLNVITSHGISSTSLSLSWYGFFYGIQEKKYTQKGLQKIPCGVLEAMVTHSQSSSHYPRL